MFFLLINGLEKSQERFLHCIEPTSNFYQVETKNNKKCSPKGSSFQKFNTTFFSKLFYHQYLCLNVFFMARDFSE